MKPAASLHFLQTPKWPCVDFLGLRTIFHILHLHEEGAPVPTHTQSPFDSAYRPLSLGPHRLHSIRIRPIASTE